MYIAYGLVILFHRNIQVTNITMGYIQLRQALSSSLWKKSWSKCIILTITYLLKIVGIVIECISNHNYTNKRNNFLNLICTLTIKELVNWNEECRQTKVNKL